ncbi:hypothetical protein BJV82DRAFT_184135 [Fennellomyces sp. T-0311]|nr:hypothetical protein BJV82DRAFT_184135 [Fennellomyces sp. T-0311]
MFLRPLAALLQTLLYDDDATQCPYPDETYQRNVNLHLPPALPAHPLHPAAIDALLSQALALELEHKPHLYSIRLIVLDFLCRQLQPNAPLLNWALCFIGQHCLNILADPSLDPLRRRIFAQCFKLRDTEGYRDLQIHRSLYDLLEDLRMPSCVWLMEIEASLHMQYHRCLQLCERILETQVTRPSQCSIHGQQFAEAIPPSTLAKSLSMQMR